MVCNENNLEISLLVMFYMTKDESCETSGVGYCGFWGDGGCDFMVCPHERPIVCLCFQPPDARDGGLGWFYDFEREATPWLVCACLVIFRIAIIVISFKQCLIT